MGVGAFGHKRLVTRATLAIASLSAGVVVALAPWAAGVAADETSSPAVTAAAEPDGATAAPLPIAPGSVQDLVTAYVRAALAAAVVDVDGYPADCLCAIAVSVSLDGPANAVALPGRRAAAAPADPAGTSGAVTARSGRSGEATAVSITGGGSASAAAASGSTGSVTVLTGSGLSTLPGATPDAPDAVTAADAVSASPSDALRRATTVDVGRLTTELRDLVAGLGDAMSRAAGAATDAQVADLLSAVPPGAAGSSATVEVAAWDGADGETSGGRLRCDPASAGGAGPSCGLAIAVTAGSSAVATVIPPRTDSRTTTGSPAEPGRPGMATAVSVALTGNAVSSARSGDEGSRPPHGALLEPGLQAAAGTPGTAGGDSTSAARSGRSGTSIAVAVTVQGAAATTAVSGDTGGAISLLGGPTGDEAAAGGSSGGASAPGLPGAGGGADAAAGSGDSGDSVSVAGGATGAAGSATSGTTGDALAQALTGTAGRDWSDGSGTAAMGTGAAIVVGGAGGRAGAASSTGSTGPSLSLVISGGSAAATAVSGDTGTAVATGLGGSGGDTHVAGSGAGSARSGDGGEGQVQGTSGGTGTSVAVLVAPYDGSGSSRSGSSGSVTSRARGGDAGCASTGVDPQTACTAPSPAPQPEATVATGGWPGFAGPAGGDTHVDDPAEPATRAAAAPRVAQPVGAVRTAGGGRTRPGPVARAEARSADSAGVKCSATAGSRYCRSADTESVRADAAEPASAPRGRGRAPAGSVTIPHGVVPLAAASATRDTSTSVTPAVLVGGGPGVPLGGDRAGGPDRADGDGVATIGLLFNAAVPLLAVLSLAAMVAVSRHKRSPRTPSYVPRHRRKQDLPGPPHRNR